MSNPLEPIIARQRELAEAKAAAEQLIKDRQAAAAKMFADTGIPALWEHIKHLKVSHWRGNGSRENNALVDIPLENHLKSADETHLALLDHDGGVKVRWYAEATDKGAVWLRVGGKEGRQGDSYTPDMLRSHFVDYMARILPPLE